jgi:VCBS repeat-containing protein
MRIVIPTLLAVALAFSACTVSTDGGKLSTNANLSGIGLSSGSLSPAFDAATIAYTVSVDNSVTSVTVTGDKADANAGVTAAVTLSGLVVGTAQTATITVTAQDGTTKKAYTVAVSRAASISTNADLSGIRLSSGSLSPAFDAVTTAYTVSVDNSVTSVTVTGDKADTNAGVTAAVTLNGLVVGTAQTATITVTAQDGTTTKTYTVAVSRAASISTNADLSGIRLSSGSLSPAFDAATTAYTVSVDNSVTSVTVTGDKADTNAGVTAAVTLSGLVVGTAQTATITVTAQDGKTKKTYTVAVTRAAAAALSTNADLKDIILSVGTLSPAFDAATTAYTVNVVNTVTSVKVSGTKADSSASVSADVTLSSLAVGTAKTATITVTAQDGTTKSYTVTVNRLSNNANLSGITLGSGTLSPAFAAATLAYTVNVNSLTTSVTVSGTAYDANASVSAPVTLTSLAIDVAQTAVITVTSQDGTATKNYTVAVTAVAPGETWTKRANVPLGTSGSGLSLAFGDNKFVAVGSSMGTQAIGVSSDGATWTKNSTIPTLCQSGSTNSYYRSVVFAHGLWVVVGDAVLTSSDLQNWTTVALPAGAGTSYTAVAYGNPDGKDVIVAAPASQAYGVVSTDGGQSWSKAFFNYSGWNSMAYGNGKFVALYGSKNVSTSPDGVTWTYNSNLPSASNSWTSVAFGNGLFVAVSGQYGSSSIAATSSDGINWTSQTLPASAPWRSVTYANGYFVAVASSGTVAATSPDGVTWTARTMAGYSSDMWYSVAYGNGTCVALGYTNASATSP